MNDKPSRRKWPAWILAATLSYVLSSGPVLGLGLWLADKTDQGVFNAVIFPYIPLLALENISNDNLIARYIEFWVEDVFGTSFPG